MLPQPHYIRPNHVSRAPHCWIFLDTEATETKTKRGARQTWALGVTCHDHQGPKRGAWRPPEWAVHQTPHELWAWVDGRVVKHGRTVVVAHNLAYDLRIAQAFTILPAMGWKLDRFRPDAESVSARWRRGPQTLLMIDSLSWWPAPLDAIGADVGLPKKPLPAFTADRSEWEARCLQDVLILQSAWRRTLDFLWREDLGTWQPTGAGQSWSAWRHRFYTHKVLAAEWAEIRPLERAACWGGRAEAWKHGLLRKGPYEEWDYASAYLAVMRECLLPGRWMGRNTRPRLDDVLNAARWHRVLSHVRVTSDVPTLPTTGPDGIVWPVGTYETVVWDNELRLALDHGARVEIVQSHYYTAEPILKAFGDWLAALVFAPRGSIDPIVQRVAKHWSRAIVGRFGVRYSTWEEFGESVNDDVTLEGFHDVDAKLRTSMLSIGGTSMVQTGLIEGENAVPSVMGYVMAETRVRLWHAIQAAGPEHVVYVDTDGLLVDSTGSRRLARRRVPGLRRKAAYRSVRVFGPRQIVLGSTLRASGVPRKAQRTGPRTWEGEIWPRLSTSLRDGEPEAVTITTRRYALKGTDHRRAHVANHETRPFDFAELAQRGAPSLAATP